MNWLMTADSLEWGLDMIADHTPTPWLLSAQYPNCIKAHDGTTIANTDNYFQEENARFIAHAVNSHEELVELAKSLSGWRNTSESNRGTGWEQFPMKLAEQATKILFSIGEK